MIFLLEDNQEIGEIIVSVVKSMGHEVEWLENGLDARIFIDRNYEKIKLCILDIMVPGVNGLDLCKAIRANEKTKHLSILMVTALATSTHIVSGLDSGADDYVTKPFDLHVLAARINALLRRNQKFTDVENTNKIVLGPIVIDTQQHLCFINENKVDLTQTELKMLTGLLQSAGKVLSRSKIIDLVCGDGISVTERVVDTHMVSMRKKLGEYAEMIETVRGVGYRIILK